MAESSKDVYTCDGCSSAIPTDRARVSCYSCANYHLCANCFVIKQFSPPHLDTHSTMVFKISGFVVPPPPGLNCRPPPLPPRTSSTTSTKQPNRLSEIPTANWGALWNVIKAPLEKKDKKPAKTSVSAKETELTPVTGSPQDGFEVVPLNKHSLNQFPPSPPKSVRQRIERVDSTAPSYPRPAKWEPLFESDGTPTPIFIALMSTLFSHLDPRHTGCLTPEIYSGLLDVQGIVLERNVWKMASQKESGDASLDLADLELGLYFSDLDVPQTLATRHKSSFFEDQNEEIEPMSAVEKIVREGMRFGANMPMLSRQGFIDLAKREYLKDPEAGWMCLKRVRQEYGIWNELGDMPRSVLPNSDVEEKQEEKPPLPPRSISGEQVKLNGGEKKIDAVLNGDEWQHSPHQSATESPVEVTEARQKVNMLLHNEETMRAEGEYEREESVKNLDVKELKESSTSQEISTVEVEKHVDELIQPSLDELDEVPTPTGARKVEANLNRIAEKRYK